MAFQPLPGLPCVTDGFAKQLLLTLLPHTSRFSMPWLVKKKWEIKKRAKGQQRKQANIMPGLSSSVQTLGIMASHRLLWRAGDVVSISLSRLLVTQMQSNFKCCHGGTVALALQNTYRIIQEKKSFPSLFLLFLSTHQVNWGKLYFNLSKKKKGEKVITPLLLLTRPSLCHSQLKPVFYTRNSERSPAPPLPNFTFASLALFLNQATRKHKDGFSDRIIMDGIVKKKKKKKALFTCLNNYWGWRIPFVGSVLCGGEDRRQRQSINQVRQKVSVLFYSKRILHFQVCCSSAMKPAAASSQCSTSALCKDMQSLPAFYTIYFFI